MNQSMKSALGRDVIALDTAESIGEVRSLVVDRSASRIERVHVAGKRSKALFAEWNAIESFGDDALMVRSAAEPEQSDDARDIDAARGTIELIGSRVLDTGGFEHGTVTDAELDAETGSLLGVTTSEGATIDADRLVSLGSYALVVRR